MSLDTILFPCAFAFSIIGIYLNLCYLRATHRTTVYAKFLNRNLRFVSWMHVFLAFSNIMFTAAVWGSKTSRTRKSEAFFSLTLALSRAVPYLGVFWIAVERLLYNRTAKLRDMPTFTHIVVFRAVQIAVSLAAEISCKSLYDQNYQTPEPEELYPGIEIKIENSLIENYYFDYYHALVLAVSAIIVSVVFKLARTSYKRAGLLGGMRNDQKVQNLRAQTKFLFHSYLPLFLAYFVDFVMQLGLKKAVSGGHESSDILHITARTFLPIAFPLSLVAVHSQLRTDYFSNFCLCRKTRNTHKESKVKVIATRESQESIIANLKMIGILSDVDNMAAAAAATGLPPKRRTSSTNRNSAISREQTSVTSTTSMAKMSNASHINVNSSISATNGNVGGGMIFQTRNSHKNSTPSIVQ